MSDQFTNEELFSSDVFAGKPAKNAESLLATLKEINQAFSDIGKTAQNAFDPSEIPQTKKQIEAFNEEVRDTKAAFNQLNKTKQDEIRVNKIITDQNKLAAKTGKQNIKSISELKLELRELSKGQKDRLKTIDKLNKSLKNVSGAQGKNSKSAKVLSGEIKRLTSELDEDESQVAQVKVQLSELNKVQRQAAKDAVGLVGAYETQSKLLLTLKKRFKDLTFEGRGSEESTIALGQQIDELDEKLRDVDESVGDFGRSVGNYEEGVKSALEGTDLFSGSMGRLNDIQGKAGAILGLLRGAFARDTKEKVKNAATTKKLDKNTKDYNKTNQKTTKGLGRLKLGLAAAGAVLLALGAGLQRSLSATQEFGDELDVLGAKASTTADVLSGSIGKQLATNFSLLKGGLTEIFGTKAEIEAARANVRRSLSSAVDSVSDLGGKIRDATRAAEDLIRSQLAFRDIRRELEKQIEVQSRIEETQRAIADDATRSFKVRETAAEKARIATENRVNLEQQLNVELVRQATAERDLAKIASTNDTANEVAKQKLFEAEIALAQAEKASLLSFIENEKQRRELVQDRLEKDLDILIDGFDNQKTINERIIADEKKTFAERRKLLNETVALSDRSFNKQIETLQKFTKENIDANDLLATSDAVVLNEKIRLLGLSEIIEGRLLEVIRDRRTADQDLADAARDLNQQEKDRIKNLNDLLDASKQFNAEQLAASLERQSTLVALENARFERRKKELKLELGEQKDFHLLIEELEKEHQERLDGIIIAETEDRNAAVLKEVELRAIQSGKTRIEIAQDVKDARIRILEEEIAERIRLSEETIDQELELAKLKQENADKEKELNKRRVKDATDTAKLIIERFKEASQERQKDIEKELSAAQKRSDELRAIGENRTLKQDENLAFQERKEAELERKRQQEIKKQARLDLLIAGINSFNAKVQSGEKGAGPSTLAEITALAAGLKAISLWEGAERVGDKVKGQIPPGRDKVAAWIDKDERVVPVKDNKKMGGISNSELGDITKMYNMGMLIPSGSENLIKVSTTHESNERMLTKMDQLIEINSTMHKRMPVQTSGYDSVEQMIWDILEMDGKTIINKKKLGRGRG